MSLFYCPTHGLHHGPICPAGNEIARCAGPSDFAEFDPPPAPLDEKIDWVHQPAFDKAFADLTGTQPENDEWRREVRWNFTGDDESYAQ